MAAALRPDLAPLPARMRKLPIDDRGFPVPWFVAWIRNADGRDVPEFRAMDVEKFRQAIKHRLCWVCGDPLGAWLAFPIGPMCSVTRTISEPPSHRECAEYSMRHCPFLANPSMVRRTEDLPEGVEQPAGFGVMRNPGVMCLWMTREYEMFRDANGKPLLTIGAPANVSWWCEGRPATRGEVAAAVESGLPILLELARRDGRFAVEVLERQYEHARALWPPEVTS